MLPVFALISEGHDVTSHKQPSVKAKYLRLVNFSSRIMAHLFGFDVDDVFTLVASDTIAPSEGRETQFPAY